MGAKLDHASKGQLDDRLFELRRVTANGLRDFTTVMAAIQEQLEGRPPQNMVPSWYLPPEIQVEKVKSMVDPGVILEIPPAPTYFKPRTRTEVLMLRFQFPAGRGRSLQDTFEICKSAIESDGRWMHASPGYADNLSFAANAFTKLGYKWVAFDPAAHLDMSTLDAQRALPEAQRVRLAGLEAIMALALFPALADQLGDLVPNMHLGGLHLNQSHGSGFLPLVFGYKPEGSNLELGEFWPDHAGDNYSNPTIRVL